MTEAEHSTRLEPFFARLQKHSFAEAMSSWRAGTRNSTART
jgi:hypothetical protein